ncbi:hypothetical protein [Candidatus Williamhamiltonella defendens]|nr:hypothetical protein [Candidatus Hamiltonella defensa]
MNQLQALTHLQTVQLLHQMSLQHPFLLVLVIKKREILHLNAFQANF